MARVTTIRRKQNQPDGNRVVVYSPNANLDIYIKNAQDLYNQGILCMVDQNSGWAYAIHNCMDCIRKTCKGHGCRCNCHKWDELKPHIARMP